MRKLLHRFRFIELSYICLVVFPSILILAQAGLCFAARGSLPDKLVADFSPLPAHIKEIRENYVILDAGKRSGIKKGDLFEVYTPGQAVIDPSTNAIIGYLKKPVAVLQVEKSGKNSSTCSVLSGSAPLNEGLPVMRYSDMSATVVPRDYISSWSAIRHEFERVFPSLVWVDSPSYSKMDSGQGEIKGFGTVLVFSVGRDSIEVFGPEDRLIARYDTPRSWREKEAVFFESEEHIAEKSKADSKKDEVLSISKEVRESRLIGRLPEPADQLDIIDLDGDGKLEIIYLVDSGVYVSPFRESTSRPASFSLDGPGRIISFSSSQGKGLLAINVLLEGVGMRSVLLRYVDGNLFALQEEINLWLSFLDRDNDGYMESLIGQTFDVDNLAGQTAYLLNPDSDSIEYLDSFRVQPNIFLPSAIWSDVNNNGVKETSTIGLDGLVRIYEGNDLLWTAPPAVSARVDAQEFVPRPMLIDGDGDGKEDVFFVAHDRRLDPDKERFMIAKWTGSEFVIVPVSPFFDGRVCGLCRVENTVVYGISHYRLDKKNNGVTELYVLVSR